MWVSAVPSGKPREANIVPNPSSEEVLVIPSTTLSTAIKRFRKAENTPPLSVKKPLAMPMNQYCQTGLRPVNHHSASPTKSPIQNFQSPFFLDLSVKPGLSEENLHQQLKGNGPTLTCSINLSGCYNVTDKTIEIIAEKFSDLTHLNLSDCPKITDEALNRIGEQLEDLQTLNLIRCTNLSEEAIFKLVTDCRSLNSVDLGKPLSDRIRFALVVRNLLPRRVEGLDLDDTFPEVEDLEELDLSAHKAFTEELLFDLISKLPKLRSVNLSTMPVSDRIVEVLTKLNTQLEEIHINAAQVSEEAMTQLHLACNPKVLSILDCPNFSSAGLAKLIYDDSHLEIVNVGGCTQLANLTEKDYFEQFRRLPSLREYSDYNYTPWHLAISSSEENEDSAFFTIDDFEDTF